MIVISAERHDGFVELRVTDHGPGFPESYLDVAFERFSRPDRGRTTEGTGLGLSIVWSIARAHGGEAHVANRPGGGADAWIRLPDGVGAPERQPMAPTRALQTAASPERVGAAAERLRDGPSDRLP
jgi:signal transduction histidine kinase